MALVFVSYWYLILEAIPTILQPASLRILSTACWLPLQGMEYSPAATSRGVAAWVASAPHSPTVPSPAGLAWSQYARSPLCRTGTICWTCRLRAAHSQMGETISRHSIPSRGFQHGFEIPACSEWTWHGLIAEARLGRSRERSVGRGPPDRTGGHRARASRNDGRPSLDDRPVHLALTTSPGSLTHALLSPPAPPAPPAGSTRRT